MTINSLTSAVILCLAACTNCIHDDPVPGGSLVEPPRIDGTSTKPPSHTFLEPPLKQVNECNGTAADIVFVLDSSTSVGPRDFIVMKNFVKSIVQKLTIGVTNSRVGLITFSRYPILRIHLNDYTTKGALAAAIDVVPYDTGITETHSALDMMQQEGFLGERPAVANVAIVITDGLSFHPNQTAASASTAQASGINMFAIGIGSKIDMTELDAIGSNPNTDHVFSVANFAALSTIVNTISNATCRVKAPVNPPDIRTTEAPPPAVLNTTGSITEDCNQTVADIVFVLDSSGSVGSANFLLMKQFVIHVTDSLDIGENATKVGVITFHNYPVLRLSLDSYDTKQDIVQAINQIPYTAGGTNTDMALDLLKDVGFVSGRPEAPDIAIVITDGKSTSPELTKTAAQQVKSHHATMFAIGIGDKIDINELNNIASDPDADHVFSVQNFKLLASIVQAVAKTTCAAKSSNWTGFIQAAVGEDTTCQRLSANTTQTPTTAITSTPTTTEPTTTTTPTTPTTPITTTTPTTPTTTTTAPTTTTTTTPTTTTAATTTSPCLAKVADVMFVLDSSGSLGADNFVKMKNFMVQTLGIFDIGTDYTRVGLITFNQHATLQFGLTRYNMSAELEQAIQNIRYSMGGTNTGEALQLLRRQGFLHDRPGKPDIAIVITDGLSADAVATKQQARLARGIGATLIAIGVGNAVDNKELVDIASKSPAANKSLVFQVGDFEELQALNSIVARVACGVSVTSINIPHMNTTNSTVVTAPPSVVNCTGDVNDDCSKYGRDICTDYHPWAIAHCAVTCGFCQGPVTPAAPCVNMRDNCNEYGTYICTQVSLIEWTKQNCAAYCGLCGNNTRPTERGPVTPSLKPPRQPNVQCTNTIMNCAEYGGESMCHAKVYEAWARGNCAEYCGFCTKFYVVPPRTLPNNATCPEWKIPKECRMPSYDGECCPLPVCPPEYKLTVEIPEP